MARLLNFKEAQMFVHDGELLMRMDGAPAKTYIKGWQEEVGIEDGTPVRITTEKHMGGLIEEVNIARAWGA